MISTDKPFAWLTNNCFLALFLLLVLVRLPYFYFVYPGLMFYDSTSSIAQFYGFQTFAATLSSTPEWILTDHHLVFFTVFIGGFVKLGELLGSMNLGIFLYVLLQIIVSNAILADCLTIVKSKVPKTWYIITVLFVAFMIPISLWQLTVSKDSYFSVFVLYLCFKTYQIIDTDFAYLNVKGHVILYVLVLVLCCLTKHQGAYMVLLLSSVLFAAYRKKALKAALALLLIGLFFLSIWPRVILPAFHVSNTGRQEALGFMFQQTARYVVDYGEDVTSEERETIAALLPYDEIPELYTLDRQDNVKFQFNQQATSKEIGQYMQHWLCMFFKHPDAYVRAITDVCKDFFWHVERTYDFVPCSIQASGISKNYPGLHMYNTQPTETRRAFREGMMAVGELPVIHLLFSYPFYTWSTAGCLALLLFRRRLAELVAFVPLFLSLCILIISPVVQFRYCLPIVYAWPFLIGLTLWGTTPLLRPLP